MGNRYIARGKRKYYWLPTAATPATVANFTAGTNLTGDLFEINGFEFNNTPADSYDMSSAFDKKVPGTDAVSDSNMVFHDDDALATLYTAMAKGNVGYVAVFNKGTAGASPAIADKYELWPAIIASRTNLHTAANETAKFRVTFTLTQPPVEGTIAA